MLFIHREKLALNVSKLTSNLSINWFMALTREEIFDSSDEDEDEIEEFREIYGDEVVIINELKRDRRTQGCESLQVFRKAALAPLPCLLVTTSSGANSRPFTMWQTLT